MRTGWELVIAGRNFDPAEFFKTSRIQPTSTWERQVVSYDSFDDSEALFSAYLSGDHKSPENFTALTESFANEQKKKANQYWQKGVEFSESYDGPYPLDMVFEALDYLLANREEFARLCALPGIEERCLNLYDMSNKGGNNFDLTPSQASILAELKISLSINISPAISVDDA